MPFLLQEEKLLNKKKKGRNARGHKKRTPIEGDMAAATGRETIGRIPMDRAGSAEDRDPPLMQDKRDNRTKDRVAAVIGERDGPITATQRSRRCWTLILTEPTDALA